MPLPTVGLVQHLRTDLGLTLSAGRPSAWADQSAMGQNVLQTTAGNRPYMLGGTIDGIPLMTFGTAGDANKFMETTGSFVDRSSVPMDGAAARTVMVVSRPAFDAAYGRTAGALWSTNTWNSLFELRGDFVANGAYAWVRAGGDYASALQFTPVTGGAGGPYDGVPILTEHSSPGFPALGFRVNNAATALTPSALYGTPGAASPARISGESIAFLGGFTEIAVWDYDLTTDPVAHAAAIAYFAATYPSIVGLLPLSLSPSSTTVVPNGRATFSAAGGSAPRVFSISVNRSGGSIDPVTGLYLAGPHGLVTDIIRVTDNAASTVEATVAVSAGLWQRFQRGLGPPSLKFPNAQIVEGDYGAEKDVLYERARQGLLTSMPTYGAADALPYTGEERKLPRATLIDGTPNETDAVYGERLRTSWDADNGWTPGGSHGSLLRALDRAGFPMGDPAGAHIMQVYKRWSWLSASGGSPVYGTHTRRWTYGGVPERMWNRYSIIFGADVPELTVGSPAADALNAIVDEWGPRKMLFMGTWIVVSGLAWGWPPGVHTWGEGGLVWGGVVRVIPPL
jgi:hypothetical protein